MNYDARDKPLSISELDERASDGDYVSVAVAIGNYELTNTEAVTLLAKAFETFANFEMMTPNRVEELDDITVFKEEREKVRAKTQWMRNAAKRLRGQDI